jgi:hypothetical protein
MITSVIAADALTHRVSERCTAGSCGSTGRRRLNSAISSVMNTTAVTIDAVMIRKCQK